MPTRPNACGEKSLWAAVLMQALSDAFTTKDGTPAIEKRTALCLLLDTSGTWARRRNEVASLAGLDGDSVRERCQRILDGKAVLSLTDGASLSIDLDEAREIYRQHQVLTFREPRPKSHATLSDHRPSVVVQKRTWLCFDVNEDGTLFLPPKTSMAGMHRGIPLPNANSFCARVTRRMTTQRGASLQGLRQAAPRDWPRRIEMLLEDYGFGLVVKKNGTTIPNATTADIDGDTRAFLRVPHPELAS